MTINLFPFFFLYHFYGSRNQIIPMIKVLHFWNSISKPSRWL